MMRDFNQIEWDDQTAEDCRQLVRLAIREDLERQYDWTTVALVPPHRTGAADVVVRKPGVVAGMPAIGTVIEQLNATLNVDEAAADGDRVEAGARVATISGNVRDLLTCERTILNLLGRMMGVATLARQYVDAVAETKARIYDTRKTIPGWRRLDKYAVRCGGAHNHRLGLYDAVLIKDNHLAQFRTEGQAPGEAAAAAIRAAREFLTSDELAGRIGPSMILEIEVDSLDQLRAVLGEAPDLALVDNMSVAMLREAVRMRDDLAPAVELEASGGMSLEAIGAVAATGVDRISVGALTHSAPALDVGLDWREAAR